MYGNERDPKTACDGLPHQRALSCKTRDSPPHNPLKRTNLTQTPSTSTWDATRGRSRCCVQSSLHSL
eukprot:4038204-Prorocentrum_lima.AAC.1